MNIFIFSPLDQFEIRILKLLTIKEFDISFSTMSLFLILVGSITVLLFFWSISLGLFLIPQRLQLILEYIYRFIINILQQQAGEKALSFFPIIFTTFFFILFSNVLGLIGFSFTPTSHIIITFTLAFSFNYAFLYLGLLWHKFKFFNLFIPRGISPVILPLIVTIEILSYLIRTVSLSVRLFANMLAGHTLLFIFASFVINLAQTKVLKILMILPFLFLFAIFLLEFAIAFLQAYVFILLVCIYLNDSLHPGH